MTINPDGRQQSLGALSGSREPDPCCTGSGPSGFDPERLQELAKRCEQTTWSGDRELDCAIYNAAPDGPNRKAERLPMEKWGDRFDDGWRTMWADREDKWPEELRRYTSSLDAALRLVPQGKRWMLYTRFNGCHAEVGWPDAGNASTAALALCAAALRAIATEARRAETPKSDSVHEGAGPKDIAPPQSPSP